MSERYLLFMNSMSCMKSIINRRKKVDGYCTVRGTMWFLPRVFMDQIFLGVVQVMLAQAIQEMLILII
ncbi:MAG: hypothetical protein COB93_08320 [Sneathiella sp.]|nr:MAG: hypothetical protein COB93_08320 [Sneathiella sp.]